MIKRVSLLLIMCFILFILSQISFAGVDRIGKAIRPDIKPTKVSDIQKDPKAFIGKEVMVAGKIKEQCPMASEGHGCFLNILALEGGEKPLYIEFEAGGLYLPRKYKESSEVKVMGIVRIKGNEKTAAPGPVKKGDVYILAQGAEIQEKD